MTNREGDRGDDSRAPLLDQVPSQRLARVAAEGYAPRRIEVPAPELERPKLAARVQRIVLATVLPPCLLALGAVMLFGLARGTAGQLAGDGGLSLIDLVMVGLLVLAAATVIMQAIALLRRHPRGRTFLAHVGARMPKLRRSEGAAISAPAHLDQIDAETLARLAPANLGSGHRLASAARSTWRTGDTLLWIALGAASLAVAAFAAFGVAYAVWSAVEHGDYTPLLVMLAVFCAMAFVGLAIMARTVVIAIFDRTKRRRRPAVIRLARAASRPITHNNPDDQRGGSTAAAIGAVAAVLLVAIAFWPEVGEALGGSDERAEALAAAVTSSPTATSTPFQLAPNSPLGQIPRATAAPGSSQAATATSEPAPAAPSVAGGAVSGGGTAALTGGSTPPPAPSTVQEAPVPTDTPAPTKVPEATSTQAPAPTAVPTATVAVTPAVTPSATPEPTPTTVVTATPTVAPTFTPTPTPTFTPTPPADSDADLVPDLNELLFGSDPTDPKSTPEHASYSADSCSDGADNDLDGDTDDLDSGCA